VTEPLAPEPSSWPPFVERWILPYTHVPGLVPVLIAIMGHIVILVVLVVLEAWRERNPFAIAASAVLVWLTLRVWWEEWKRLRRVGPLTVTLACSWVATFVVAALAMYYGFL
jgi:hypothetical protein